MISTEKVKLFSLGANRSLAEEISEYSKIPLGNMEIERFADGEMMIDILESVRGCHVFVVQPTSNPVNEHLMELLILVDALKRASVSAVTVIMPYFGYSRQDKKTKPRQPITAKLIADLLQTAGVNRVVAVDLHAAQIQGFFDVPIDNLFAAPLLAKYFINKKLSNIVVVSPDHGGATRARAFAKMLDAPLAIIDKRRPESNVAEVMSVMGNVEGKTAIIIDDIVDTAGTLLAGVEALIKHGAKEVYAAATHPVFSTGSITKIHESQLKEIVVSNTIEITNTCVSDKIKKISVGPLLGEAIVRIVNNEPISPLFEDIKQY